MTSPYLDLPRVALADALKAGIKAICAIEGRSFHFEPCAMPEPADASAYPLTLATSR